MVRRAMEPAARRLCVIADYVRDLFKTNAGIIADLAAGVVEFCPKALVGIITNPVNSTVPIAAEVLKKNGQFDPRRLFGVTTLDVVRGSKFVADVLGNVNPQELKVPVVGGHSGATILPLISQSQPAVQLNQQQIEAITNSKDTLVLCFCLRFWLKDIQQGFNLVVTKSSKRRLVRARPQPAWPTLVSGQLASNLALQ